MKYILTQKQHRSSSGHHQKHERVSGFAFIFSLPVGAISCPLVFTSIASFTTIQHSLHTIS